MKTRPRARATRRGSEGFTLLEVMIAVAILSVSMTGLYTAQMANMNATAYARDITAVSFLAEYIIVDLERRMAKDGGWVAQDKTYDGDFGEEGWPKIKYSCLIDFVEMPEYSQLREAKEDADTDGGGTQYQDAGDQMFSALGVVWPMVKNAIEQSIRKVSCTIVWPRGGDTEETLLIETYWTEPANLTKLPDLGGEFTEDGEDGGGGQSGGSGGPGGRPGGGASGGTSTRPGGSGPTGARPGIGIGMESRK